MDQKEVDAAVDRLVAGATAEMAVARLRLAVWGLVLVGGDASAQYLTWIADAMTGLPFFGGAQEPPIEIEGGAEIATASAPEPLARRRFQRIVLEDIEMELRGPHDHA